MLSGSRNIKTILLGIAGISLLASPVLAGVPSGYKAHYQNGSCPSCFSKSGNNITITNKGKYQRVELSSKHSSRYLKYKKNYDILISVKPLEHKAKFTTIFQSKPQGGSKEPGYPSSWDFNKPDFLVVATKSGKIKVRYANGKGGKSKTFNTKGRLRMGQWNDFKVRIRRSMDRDGYLQIMLNGKVIYDKKGQTASSLREASNFKFGAYNRHHKKVGLFRGVFSKPSISRR